MLARHFALVLGLVVACPLAASGTSLASASQDDAALAKRVAVDFGEHGNLEAIETLRTPGVWEGRIVTGPLAGGIAMVIATGSGEVRFAQGPDGSLMQSLPTGGGGRIAHSNQRPRECGAAIEPPRGDVPNPGPAEGGLAGNCEDGSVLDILVKWTPQAESDAGGPVAMRALAEAAVAMSNHVYIASGVNVYMRAVGYGVTEPFDGDADEDVIYTLTIPDDGILDAVHAERDQVGADLVALLTADSPYYCGIAWLLGEPYPSYGFSVTVWGCVPGLTFTHEIGHNQGCCHAPCDGGDCSTTCLQTDYAFGHRFIASNSVEYRTVLAYAPGVRAPRLSSPEVSFLGAPTGIATRDNARRVTETAAIMSSFRCADPCDIAPVKVKSPKLPMPASGGAVTFTANNVETAAFGGQVEIVFTASGDLGNASETLSLRIGSTSVGVTIGGTGTDCTIASRTTSIPASLFNAAIGAGDTVEFAVQASAAVDAWCNYAELTVEIRYLGTATECESDVDGDGTTGGTDLAALLAAWGPCTGCAADIDGDGLVEGKDLAIVLSGWGSCSSTPQWATVLERCPDPSVISDPALRDAIKATGLPWRVRDTATQIEMLLIPPGEFSRGCSPSVQHACSTNESPVHPVLLTRALYMSRHEVTQAQWTAVRGSNPSFYWFASSQVPSADVPRRPVEQVSWSMVQQFLLQTGLRLPTEAEWEYAYRAGTTTAFHGMPGAPDGTADDSMLGAIAWFGGNASAQTRPVGAKAGNGFGLHDMSGNVWEWVSDWQGPYSAGQAINPSGPPTGTQRVYRGGGIWDAGSCRASYRGSNTPSGSFSDVGFRVARDP